MAPKIFILLILAAVHIPWPSFGDGIGEGTKSGKLTQFSGTPDVVEVDDLKGDRVAIEANGASVFISIFSSIGSSDGKETPTLEKDPQ